MNNKEKVWAILHQPEGLLPICADAGDLIPINRFLESVAHGWFVDYDGFGEWATSTHYLSGHWVHPSDISNSRKPIPKWATHVVWYNR